MKAIASILVLFAAGASRAQVIFDDFGAANSFDPGVSYLISDPTQLVAVPFTCQSVLVSDVTLAVGTPAQPDQSVTYEVSIDVDNGSETPGATVAGWSFTLSGSAAEQEVFTTDAPSGVFLSQGSYYLELSTESVGSWYGNDTGATGFSASAFGGWSAHPLLEAPALRINGSPAPEPLSIVALACGISLLLLRRRGSNSAPNRH